MATRGRVAPPGDELPACGPGRAEQQLGVGLRGLRSRPGGAAGGAVHPRQRLLRHAGRGARGPRRRRALPGHLRRRLLRPPGHRGRRANGRERGHRERAELAAADVPDRQTASGSTSAGSTFSATGRSSTYAAGCSPVSCDARDPAGQGDAGDPAAVRRHVAAAPGRAGDHDRGRELVGADRAALGPRRHGDQLRGRSLPGLRGDHLVPVEQGDLGGGGIYLQVQTRQSRIFIAEAARTRSGWTDGPSRTVRAWSTSRGSSPTGCVVDVASGGEAHRREGGRPPHLADPAISEPGLAARTAVEEAGGFAELLEPHVLAWDQLWGHFDLPLAGQRGRARPQAPHLPPAADRLAQHHRPRLWRPGPGPARRGVPRARLLGRAVRLPAAQPEAPGPDPVDARLPLPRLAAARRRLGARAAPAPCSPGRAAATVGRRPRRCTSTPGPGGGCPTTPTCSATSTSPSPTTSWSYYQVTGDVEFLRFRGAPMIIEIARFLAGLATYNDALDRYEIKGVMGPDEYHDGYPGADGPGLDNNAYTNVMTVWVVCRALEILDLLPDHHAAGAAGSARPDHGRARPLGRRQPQDAGLLPRRCHQPVRGLRAPRGARLARLPGALRRHPAARPDPRGRR